MARLRVQATLKTPNPHPKAVQGLKALGLAGFGSSSLSSNRSSHVNVAVVLVAAAVSCLSKYAPETRRCWWAFSTGLGVEGEFRKLGWPFSTHGPESCPFKVCLGILLCLKLTYVWLCWDLNPSAALNHTALNPKPWGLNAYSLSSRHLKLKAQPSKSRSVSAAAQKRFLASETAHAEKRLGLRLLNPKVLGVKGLLSRIFSGLLSRGLGYVLGLVVGSGASGFSTGSACKMQGYGGFKVKS